MKRQAIPDFTDTELSVVRETARERFRRDMVTLLQVQADHAAKQAAEAN